MSGSWPLDRGFAYGKLPVHREYLGIPEITSGMPGCDEWFQAGLASARETRRRAFDAEFDARPPLAIAYLDARVGSACAGTCRPSRDGVGRTFPLHVLHAFPPPPSAGAVADLPLTAADLFAASLELSGGPWEGTTLDDFRARLEQLPACRLAPQSADEPHSSDLLWSGLPGFEAPSRRAALLYDVATLLERYPPGLVLTLPFVGGSAAIAARLHLLLDRIPGGQLPQAVAWDAGADRGTIRVLFDRFRPRSFLPFFWPELDHDYGYDLAHTAPVADRRQTAAEGRFLQTAQKSVLSESLTSFLRS